MIMKDDIITRAKPRRGIEPDATMAEIRLYKKWLTRVLKGSDIDDYLSFSSSRQNQRCHPIDIKDKILPFFKSILGLEQ